MTKQATYRITNEFHGFEKDTTSENHATVRKIVRSSKPSDCTSRTVIYRIVDGKIAGRVDFDGDEIRDM